jgi:hypothetical protein
MQSQVPCGACTKFAGGELTLDLFKSVALVSMAQIGQAHGTETHCWIVLVWCNTRRAAESACGRLGSRWRVCHTKGHGEGTADTHSLDEAAFDEAEC